MIGIKEKINEARNSIAYQGYLKVRDWVTSCLEEEGSKKYQASSYWEEEIEGFDYMFDASPLIINKLREHCYHITGIKSYDYRAHHRSGTNVDDYFAKLDMLKELDTSNLFIEESEKLGGFGYVKNNVRINVDTLKFYESLIALNKDGILKSFRNTEKKPIALEIGTGWGGFAYQFKLATKPNTYILVDLPHTLLFSATYLLAQFPNLNHKFITSSSLSDLNKNLSEYDFIYIPASLWDQIKNLKVDLAMNLISFQEMTTEQVDGYVGKLKAMGCPKLYSHNRDKSGYNEEITSVEDIIKKHYDIKVIEMLDVSYTDIGSKLEKIRRKQEKGKPDSRKNYKHIIGS